MDADYPAKGVKFARRNTSIRSIPDAFSGDPLSPCYASNVEALIAEKEPDLWVHGHVHTGQDYTLGRTRVVSNPRGYPGEARSFDPGLIVEI